MYAMPISLCCSVGFISEIYGSHSILEFTIAERGATAPILDLGLILDLKRRLAIARLYQTPNPKLVNLLVREGSLSKRYRDSSRSDKFSTLILISIKGSNAVLPKISGFSLQDQQTSR